VDFPLEDVVAYIDWSPFFQTWELRGRYPNRGFPKIFNDERVGEEARKLYADAQAMLKEIIAGKLLSLRAAHGIWPANSTGDEDILVFADEERSEPIAKFACLRQQLEKERYVLVGRAFVCCFCSAFKCCVGLFSQLPFFPFCFSRFPSLLSLFSFSLFSCVFLVTTRICRLPTLLRRWKPN
jgi:cobalamin-dependent methionine synthase I